MLTPDVVVGSLHDVDPDLLARHGASAVLIDLDDTLVASNSTTADPQTRRWLASLRQADIPVAVLSNGDRARVERLCSELGLVGVHLAGKPFWWAFRRGQRLLGRPPAETAMVGDQLFTDVFGANLAGMVSVLVRPLTPGKLPHTRAARRLERLLLKGRVDWLSSHPGSRRRVGS